jgi:hypothetical protein
MGPDLGQKKRPWLGIAAFGIFIGGIHTFTQTHRWDHNPYQ